jgi:hypothetical protein
MAPITKKFWLQKINEGKGRELEAMKGWGGRDRRQEGDGKREAGGRKGR